MDGFDLLMAHLAEQETFAAQDLRKVSEPVEMYRLQGRIDGLSEAKNWLAYLEMEAESDKRKGERDAG